MKKVIRIIALLLLLMPVVVNAKTITKEDLKNAYKYIVECNQEGNYTKADGTVTFNNSLTFGDIKVCKDTVTGASINTSDYITDDTIYYSIGNKKYEIKYQIKEDGKVEFRHTYTLERSTAVYEDLDSYDDNYENVVFIGLQMVGVAGGLKYGEVELYTALTGMDLQQTTEASNVCTIAVETQSDYDNSVATNPDCIVVLKSDFSPKAIEYAKRTLGDKDAVVNDEDDSKLYSVSLTHDLTDPDKYVKSYVLTVDANSELFNFAGLPDGGIKASVDPTAGTTANPKTGAFMSVITVIALLGVLILISLKNRSYINKI